MGGIAAVLFDFDGTIVDTEAAVFASWAELWADHGEELALDHWQSILGTVGGFDPAAALADRIGRAVPEAALAGRRARRDSMLHAEPVRPGVRAWLDAADELGVPVAIASSSPSAWVDDHLVRLGLLDRFAFVACADPDGGVRGKPDPDVYELAARAVGADPARSVAVEDSPNGVRAAVAAGLWTVAVPHPLTAALAFDGAAVVLAGLDELALPDALAAAAARTFAR